MSRPASIITEAAEFDISSFNTLWPVGPTSSVPVSISLFRFSGVAFVGISLVTVLILVLLFYRLCPVLCYHENFVPV